MRDDMNGPKRTSAICAANKNTAEAVANVHTAERGERRYASSAANGPMSSAPAARSAGKRNPANAGPVRSKNFDIASVLSATCRSASTDPRSKGTGKLREDQTPASRATPAAIPKTVSDA